MQVYWIYWAVCFSTVITWAFAVTAAADSGWVQSGGYEGYFWVKLGEGCESYSFCGQYRAGTAFQFMATILISITMAVAAISAFTPASTAKKLGRAAGISLLLFSLFQMIAFSVMATFARKLNSLDPVYVITAGPTLGVAVMACLFGLAEGVAILFLAPRATSPGEDGPFLWCRSRGAATSQTSH